MRTYIARSGDRMSLTDAEVKALIAYYRVGIDGLQHVKGKTIKSLMDKGCFTARDITLEGRALAKELSDEEHEKIFKNPGEPMVRKTTQGYEVSDIINGYRVHKHYIGYTKREAITLFKREHYTKRRNPTSSATARKGRMRFYVGARKGGSGIKYEVFWTEINPTQKTHGSWYSYVIGPFNSKRGADFMAKYGMGNPHCQSVADAERLARIKNPALKRYLVTLNADQGRFVLDVVASSKEAAMKIVMKAEGCPVHAIRSIVLSPKRKK